MSLKSQGHFCMYKAHKGKVNLPVFPREMDAGVLKNFIFLFLEIFDLVCQSMDEGSLLQDFPVSLLKESY